MHQLRFTSLYGGSNHLGRLRHNSRAITLFLGDILIYSTTRIMLLVLVM